MFDTTCWSCAAVCSASIFRQVIQWCKSLLLTTGKLSFLEIHIQRSSRTLSCSKAPQQFKVTQCLMGPYVRKSFFLIDSKLIGIWCRMWTNNCFDIVASKYGVVEISTRVSMLASACPSQRLSYQCATWSRLAVAAVIHCPLFALSMNEFLRIAPLMVNATDF